MVESVENELGHVVHVSPRASRSDELHRDSVLVLVILGDGLRGLVDHRLNDSALCLARTLRRVNGDLTGPDIHPSTTFRGGLARNLEAGNLYRLRSGYDERCVHRDQSTASEATALSQSRSILVETTNTIS